MSSNTAMLGGAVIIQSQAGHLATVSPTLDHYSLPPPPFSNYLWGYNKYLYLFSIVGFVCLILWATYKIFKHSLYNGLDKEYG
jgi:hypothetical protein